MSVHMTIVRSLYAPWAQVYGLGMWLKTENRHVSAAVLLEFFGATIYYNIVSMYTERDSPTVLTPIVFLFHTP